MTDSVPRSEPALESLLSHVHIALMPDAQGVAALSDLQVRIHRLLPPEHAKRAVWVPPEFFGIVLAYAGSIRPSLLDALQDILKGIFLPEPLFALQVHRFSTAHDPQGTPRVIGAGLADFAPLFALRERLTAALERLGIDCLPREFVARITLARLPENAGPVMSILENLTATLPLTLNFSHVDLASRDGRQRHLWARVFPGKEPSRGIFEGVHGCCREQSNRFALYGTRDCPMRNAPRHQLDCFETGCTPAHPPEAPPDAKVEADLVHEGMQDLLRSGRLFGARPAAGTTDATQQQWKEPAPKEHERRTEETRPKHEKPAAGRRDFSLPTNHRDPRKPEKRNPETAKKPAEQEPAKPNSREENRPQRHRGRDRRRKPQGAALVPAPSNTPEKPEKGE